MSQRTYRTFQALILAGLGVFLFGQAVEGDILSFIHPRLLVMVLGAALLCMAIAQAALRDRNSGEETQRYGATWGLWLLALPLLIGVLMPVRPPGVETAALRGVVLSGRLSAFDADIARAVGTPPGERSVQDWVRSFSVLKAAEVMDQPVDVSGTIVREDGLAADEFLVTRSSLTCCVANSATVGMVVRWPGPAATGQWVRVRGKIVAGFAIEAASVETIPEPEQPYLFP